MEVTNTLGVAVVQEHLDEVLPAVLGGLADEAEGVRDAALAAGRTAVELFAQTSLPLLLPAVEAGIMDDNWRIRQSSVELLGDLLFKVQCCSFACTHQLEWPVDTGAAGSSHMSRAGQLIANS